MNERSVRECIVKGDFLFSYIDETREAIDIAKKLKEFLMEKLKIKGFDI